MSLAAASILRLRSNWTVIAVAPSELVDVICETPGICAICRSSGCATEDAIVSGEAPGSDAETAMVGKSTWGRGATGSDGNATRPTRSTATMISVVAIGRLIKGAERPLYIR